ncbi:MAG: type 2 isopentenyl-diphosphate Delta-isomerase [Chloroflexi bacterium]|nr:type 2 isopentenyl-diphosphate Delta-isomerase [Chloroflexota bacterium]
MSEVTQTATRKADHIRINLEEDVRSALTNGLERYAFLHQALPELDLAQVSLAVDAFGKRLRAPLLITQAQRINLTLAEAAQARGIAMGLGSQRVALERPELAPTFQVRRVAPDILLFANLGAVQLNYGYGVDHCRRAVDMIGADALILHLNALQEALQPEGDTHFAGLLGKIEAVCRALGPQGVPVIVKEVGWGFSPQAARQLAGAGVAAIDVAGAGGTSWSQVEMHRAQTESQRRIAQAFRDWGIPTARAIRNVREAAPQLTVIASGGLRDGVDVARCLALGATLGGMAGPFLRAASQSVQAVLQTIEEVTREIRIVMFATGSASYEALRTGRLLEVP